MVNKPKRRFQLPLGHRCGCGDLLVAIGGWPDPLNLTPAEGPGSAPPASATHLALRRVKLRVPRAGRRFSTLLRASVRDASGRILAIITVKHGNKQLSASAKPRFWVLPTFRASAEFNPIPAGPCPGNLSGPAKHQEFPPSLLQPLREPTAADGGARGRRSGPRAPGGGARPRREAAAPSRPGTPPLLRPPRSCPPGSRGGGKGNLWRRRGTAGGARKCP